MMITESLLIKGLGTLAGTVLALIFIPPKSIAGFIRRTTASLIAGPIFSPVTHSFMEWPSTAEYWLAASALTAFISWWCLGMVVSAARKWIESKASNDTD